MADAKFDADFQQEVESIRDEIENAEDVYAYFDENEIYNIEFRVDGQKNYKSVELMVACGGPNIYIDTQEKAVCGYWWGSTAKAYLTDDIVDEIDRYWEDYYGSF